MAQLGSAGALGAYLFTNENDCNNSIYYFYYKLKSEGKRQNFTSAGAFKNVQEARKIIDLIKTKNIIRNRPLCIK